MVQTAFMPAGAPSTGLDAEQAAPLSPSAHDDAARVLAQLASSSRDSQSLEEWKKRKSKPQQPQERSPPPRVEPVDARPQGPSKRKRIKMEPSPAQSRSSSGSTSTNNSSSSSSSNSGSNSVASREEALALLRSKLANLSSERKGTSLLSFDDVLELLQAHGVDAARVEPELVLALQAAVNDASQLIVTDVCAAKKRKIASSRHLSVSAPDVRSAADDLSRARDFQRHRFYHYARGCGAALGVADPQSAAVREDIVARRDNPQGRSRKRRKLATEGARPAVGPPRPPVVRAAATPDRSGALATSLSPVATAAAVAAAVTSRANGDARATLFPAAPRADRVAGKLLPAPVTVHNGFAGPRAKVNAYFEAQLRR